MKLKNALKKIIHSVCLISVLFLSVFFVLPPVESFAEAAYLVPKGTNTNTSIRTNGVDIGFIYIGALSDWRYAKLIAKDTFTEDFYCCYVYADSEYRLYVFTLANGSASCYIGCSTTQGGSVTNIYAISTTSNSNGLHWGSLTGRISSNTLNPDFPVFQSFTSAFNHYFNILVATPEPATPTPTPTPTPAPASPTPDANAEAFFGKLGSDAQNGFGAILTAWTAANSHFYTSVLFIVLPVFLGIVGLIASFFFGGGDDD